MVVFAIERSIPLPIMMAENRWNPKEIGKYGEAVQILAASCNPLAHIRKDVAMRACILLMIHACMHFINDACMHACMYACMRFINDACMHAYIS